MALVKELEHLKISLDVIKLATDGFSAKNLIGVGGFGKVCKGEIANTEGLTKNIVIKRLDKKHLSSNALTGGQRLKICNVVALGLEYLHNPLGTQQRVLHQDVKSANILLHNFWEAKI
ncbi:Phloem protein 2-like protein [Artemisia annua]|uniref:Phloem protein 2-like protein n=1 Tax=Artemisia annua TaxID=35608 RepID=A0A2U1Q557_ARTAN|nr:Phloem protein 2-like protein [Artemisia annua]